LQVLYNFMVEFSKFDWDRYCLSLQGPVLISDLPSQRGEHAGTLDGAAGSGDSKPALHGRLAAPCSHRAGMRACLRCAV
jgi:hypothetical protein